MNKVPSALWSESGKDFGQKNHTPTPTKVDLRRIATLQHMVISQLLPFSRHYLLTSYTRDGYYIPLEHGEKDLPIVDQLSVAKLLGEALFPKDTALYDSTNTSLWPEEIAAEQLESQAQLDQPLTPSPDTTTNCKAEAELLVRTTELLIYY